MSNEHDYDEAFPGSPDEPVAPDSTPLCPECLTPVEKGQFYCSNCGSDAAINPITTYMPFVRLKFEVGAVLKALYFYPAFGLVLVGIGYPMIGLLALPVVIINFIARPETRTSVNVIATIAVSALLFAFWAFAAR